MPGSAGRIRAQEERVTDAISSICQWLVLKSAAIVVRPCLAGRPRVPGLLSRIVCDQVTGSVARALASRRRTPSQTTRLRILLLFKCDRSGTSPGGVAVGEFLVSEDVRMTKIYVGNLPFSADETAVRELF